MTLPTCRRVLVASNHMRHIAGSEVVALEWVRHFLARGCEVTVHANDLGGTMAALLEELGDVKTETDASLIKPFTFDLVYAQHQVLPLFDYAPSPLDREATPVIIGRLSPRSFMESGGWGYEGALADRLFANSAETAESLRRAGADTPITIFHNAAPSAFFRPCRERPPAPRHITVVTNHKDEALLGAIELLRETTEVRHLGRKGTRNVLVTPEILQETDLVISIGKTVQYALAGRIPVYVYDHFGGPGYLTPDNIRSAQHHNFSGRCCERRLSAREIANEVIGSYGQGVAFARRSDEDWLRTFELEPYLDDAASLVARSNLEKRAAMQTMRSVIQERMMAEYVRKAYADAQASQKTIKRLQAKLQAHRDAIARS